MNQTGREELAESTHPEAGHEESDPVAAEDESGLAAAEDESGLAAAEDERDAGFVAEQCLHLYICRIHSDALGVRQAVHSGAGPHV